MKVRVSRRAVRSVFVVAGSLAALNPAVPVSQADSAGETAPIAVQGEAPSEATEVLLFAMDDKSRDNIEERIAVPATQSSVVGGHYEVQVDPATVPANAITAGGRVEFEVVFGGPNDQAWVTYASAVAVSDAGGDSAWVDPSVVSNGNNAGRRPGIVRNTRAVSAAVVDDDEDYGVDTETFGQADVEMLIPTGHCQFEHYDYDSWERRVWAKIGSTWPVDDDKAWMNTGSSHSSRYGVAFRAAGEGASWERSGSVSRTDGFSFTWKPAMMDRTYKKQIEYWKWVEVCVVRGIRKEYGYKWTARGGSGGTDTDVASFPDYRNCVPVDAGEWTRVLSGRKEYSNSAGVEFSGIIGLDLGVTRDYSTSNSVHYMVSRGKKMCGSNDRPAFARRVQERYLGD